mmetsp:Transcript_48760/g.120926  ORF Transcript_48760/g.120926 Transcript_48760/m.120926 type:complete len:96 (+) Transcript_48760:1097-1384(+)
MSLWFGCEALTTRGHVLPAGFAPSHEVFASGGSARASLCDGSGVRADAQWLERASLAYILFVIGARAELDALAVVPLGILAVVVQDGLVEHFSRV